MKSGWVGRIEEGLVALLITLMTLITFVQVVARYVFNYSFVWALELTGVMFAWLIFVGMSYGVRVGAHIGVDALVSLMPRGIRRGVSVVVGLPGTSRSQDRARSDGFEVLSPSDAAARGDVVMFLIPDHLQADTWRRDVRENLRPGAALAFAHGFSVHFGQIEPGAGTDGK